MPSPTLTELPPPPPDKTGYPWSEQTPQLPETMSDGTPWPRISIVTPSYNQGQYIEETIRSVLMQGYPNLDYIIIDGGSTDNSIAIIQKYALWLSYWVSEKDNGQTYAIQKGMQFADGIILNWLNADDFLLPGALVSIAKGWGKDKNSCVICGNAIRVNSHSELLYSSPVCPSDDLVKLLPTAPPVNGGIQASFFFTRDLWDGVGGLNLSLDYTMDTDLYFRYFALGANFVLVDYAVAALRIHYDTKTLRGWDKSLIYKKRFYYSKYWQLTMKERKLYGPRIRRFLYSLYLKSITPADGFFLRLRKIWGAINEFPECLLQPYQVKIILYKFGMHGSHSD